MKDYGERVWKRQDVTERKRETSKKEHREKEGKARGAIGDVAHERSGSRVQTSPRPKAADLSLSLLAGSVDMHSAAG